MTYNLWELLQELYSQINSFHKSKKEAFRVRYFCLQTQENKLRKVQLEYIAETFDRKKFIHKALGYIGEPLQECDFSNISFQDNYFFSSQHTQYLVIKNENTDLQSFYLIKEALQLYMFEQIMPDNRPLFMHCLNELTYLIDSYILHYHYAKNERLSQTIEQEDFKQFLISYYQPIKLRDIYSMKKVLLENKFFLDFIHFSKKFPHLIGQVEQRKMIEAWERQLCNTQVFSLPTQKKFKTLPPQIQYNIEHYLVRFLKFLDLPFNEKKLHANFNNLYYIKNKTLIDSIDKLINEGVGTEQQRKKWPRTTEFLKHVLGFSFLATLPLTLPLFIFQAKQQTKLTLDINQHINDNIFQPCPNIAHALFLSLPPQYAAHYSQELKNQISATLRKFVDSPVYKKLDMSLTPNVEKIIIESNSTPPGAITRKSKLHKI